MYLFVFGTLYLIGERFNSKYTVVLCWILVHIVPGIKPQIAGEAMM